MKWNKPDAERQDKTFIKTENRMVLVRGLREGEITRYTSKGTSFQLCKKPKF